MKLYGKDINIVTNKTFVSSNVIKLISNLVKENSRLVLIKNGDFFNHIFDFKKDSPLYFYLEKEYPEITEKILNQEVITNFANDFNEKSKLSLLDINMEFHKIFKIIFEFQENYVNEKNINQILKIFSYSPKIDYIVLIGFDNIKNNQFQIPNKAPLVFIVQALIGNISLNEIETLVIDNNDDFYEIESKQSFLNYLELKSRTVLTLEDLENYFKGKNNFNSFLIDKSIRSIIKTYVSSKRLL